MTQVSVLDLGGEQKPAEKKRPIEFNSRLLLGEVEEFYDTKDSPKLFDKVRLISRGPYWDLIAGWNNGSDLREVGVYLGHWNDGVVE